MPGLLTMFREQRRIFFRKNRFKPWYRKCNHFLTKRRQIDSIIFTFCGDVSNAKRRQLRWDMIWSLFRYGAYFNEYFLFGFGGMPHSYRNSFITEAIRLSYYPRMNNPGNTDLLENKYRAYLKFKPLYRRELLCIRKKEPVTEAVVSRFMDFSARHHEYIVKPLYAAFGKGVHRDSLVHYGSARDALESYHQQDTVLEEIITQDERMASIHPQSVNTLRIPTVIVCGIDGRQEVQLFHPSLRVGRGGSVIDNLSAGGISALIDPETGAVYTDGADKKGHRYPLHPDTGIKFQGFCIPDWELAVTMVKNAALTLPDNHYCGWDLALSAESGWCIVEANSTAQMGAMQLVTKTGRKHELEALISRM